MEDITPTFCKDNLPSTEKDSISFSVACKGIRKSKLKGKYSCSNLNFKSKIPYKSQKEKSKFKVNQKRHHPQKFNLKKIVDIHSNNTSEKVTLNEKTRVSLNIKKTFYNKDIRNLMKKNKFRLRNDFDRKHTEQFLFSKEAAFEMPFLLNENIV